MKKIMRITAKFDEFFRGVEDAAPYNNGIYLILYMNIFRRGAPMWAPVRCSLNYTAFR